MILLVLAGLLNTMSKPRASGDDPAPILAESSLEA